MKTITAFVAFGVISLAISTNASLWTDIRDTATAPARAVVEAAKDPTPENIITAANPTIAQAKEADKKIGVTDGLKQVAKVPKNANEALKSTKQTADNANQGVNEARQMLPAVNTAIGDTRSDVAGIRADVAASRGDLKLFLGAISLPAQILLWALVAFVLVKFFKLLARPHNG